jgi:MSHA biogenesis protein MshE
LLLAESGETARETMGKPEKIRLGDLLVQQRLISSEQLKLALEQQKRSGRKLGKVLVESGFVTEDQISESLARQLGVSFINLKYFNLPPDVARQLPESQARRYRALLLEDRKTRYLVGMSDPTDLFAFDEISRILRKEIDLAVVNEGLLLQTIDRVYRRTEEITGLAKELEADLGETAVDFGVLGANLSVEDAPVVRLLQTLFEDATQVKASDIHIEPQEHRVQIRFRIDGELILQTETDPKIGPALVLRLKIMAGLDISEKRLPQDGRFNVKIRDQQVDVRMSTMPVQYGESAVMRLLNTSGGLLGLDRLGIPEPLLGKFRELIHRSSGMILVTGPTGSGKTTTLYAALSEVNSVDQKIITVEDPVEYRLSGINQVQVNEKIELSFSRVLRSALRQDPDIILVGEMRDEETAEIGLRAALTGHLVFSTLHTRDAASTPIRLIDMGAPNYMVATSLNAVLAQRLVRLVCESCAEPYSPTPQEIVWATEEGQRPAAGPKFMRGKGCTHCNGTGYYGRTGVYELLDMSPDLVQAIGHRDPTVFMRAAQARLAGQTLRSHALALAAAGRTTLAEAMRATSQVED